MNRSTGAYAPLKFHNFCIMIRLAEGGFMQVIRTETAPKRALGQVFSELKRDGVAVAEKAVAMCKRPDQMTYDDRWSWGVQTSEDEVRHAREMRTARSPMSDLDLY